MADKLKEIQSKVLEWWNKFTSRQKTIIIGIGAVVVFTFAILIYVFTKPQYANLITCENTKDASEVVSILESAGIQHRESRNGLLIEVLEKQLSDASLALGSAGYAPDDYTPEMALGGGISTTEADKQKKWGTYLERKLEKDLAHYSAVKSATAHLNIPVQDGTLISKQVNSSAYIQLELEGEFTAENAANMAKAVATFLHNDSTADIVIMDTEANLLFSGADDYSTAGVAGSMLELRQQAEGMVAGEIKKVLLNTKQFDMVEVASRLEINFSNYEKTIREYYAPEGHDQGMITHEETLDSESTNGNAGGVPGTDANDSDNETTYMYQNGGNSSSTDSERSTDYLPNSSEERQITPAGGIDYGKSSVSITGIALKEIREEDAKAQGLLDGMTWKEYKAANGEDVKIEPDPDFISIVSNATGIGEDKITILAYERPVFIDKTGMNVSTTDVLSIAMLVIILGLLAFVVLRSMRSKQEVQEEEELSVENLLQSTPESDLEDIELENKSETRKMIEKFVDDNPEAAANLLRNWLTEDWG